MRRMSATPRTDFYTFFHKGLRRRLFETTVTAGASDAGDAEARERLAARIEALVALLRLHARLEEDHLHPLIAAKLPEQHARLEREHHHHEEELAGLEQALARVRGSGAAADGLALYRALARFCAGYLAHLDAEEAGMTLLWEGYDEPTLAQAFAGMMKTRTLDDLAMSWELMLPALAPAERAAMALAVKAAPPPVFARFAAVAEASLPAEDWARLR
jgi:hypothetical protein